MITRRLTLAMFCAVAGIALPGPVLANDLYDAAKARDDVKVLQLLDAGADPNKRSPYDGPLHVAARIGPPETVTALLESGADMELPGYGGVRPLHAAALAGQGTVVAMLLERGAKVDSLDNVGRTPLMSLVSGATGDLNILKALLEFGANPNLMDGPIHLHALDYAAFQGRADVAEILLAFGADINAKDSIYGRTALHYAIAYCVNVVSGHQEVVELLIAYGADVNLKDGENLTPLQYAKRHAPGNGLLHHMLIKAGAK